ncbi:MAG: hypothetical protein GEV08_08355 [Acidimicrobiia bacterium]|nr:hypothetical protein [Acidimicrobiia bacterium]
MTSGNGLVQAGAWHVGPPHDLEEDVSVLDMGALGRALRRRWWLVLLSAAAAVAIALGIVAGQPKVYASSTSLLFTATSDGDPSSDGELASQPDRYLRTQAELMLSAPVRDAAEASTGIEADYTVEPVFETDLLEVRAEAGTPERAATTANAVVDAYLAQRGDQSAAELEAATEELTSQIAAIDDEIAAIDGQLAAAAPAAATAEALSQQRAALINERLQLRVALARGESPAAAPQLSARIAQLDAEIAALDAELATGAASSAGTAGLDERRASLIDARGELRTRLDDWTVGSSLAADGARQLAPAEAHDTPVAPTPVRTVAFALAIGLVVGVVLALLTDRASPRVRTAKDLRRAVPEAPVLAEISARGTRRSRGDKAGAGPADQVRELRSALARAGDSGPPRRVQLTSASPGVNTAGLAADLASSFADIGLRALVVDANLRDPQLGAVLGLGRAPGLTELLRGERTVAEVVLAARDRPLGALPAGRPGPTAGELLGGGQLAALLAELADSCDVLVIDTPAVLDHADAAIVSLFVDTSLVATTPGRSTLHEVRAALDALGRVSARVGGLVLIDGPYELSAAPAPPGRAGAAAGDAPAASFTDVDRGAAPAI